MSSELSAVRGPAPSPSEDAHDPCRQGPRRCHSRHGPGARRRLRAMKFSVMFWGKARARRTIALRPGVQLRVARSVGRGALGDSSAPFPALGARPSPPGLLSFLFQIAELSAAEPQSVIYDDRRRRLFPLPSGRQRPARWSGSRWGRPPSRRDTPHLIRRVPVELCQRADLELTATGRGGVLFRADARMFVIC